MEYNHHNQIIYAEQRFGDDMMNASVLSSSSGDMGLDDATDGTDAEEDSGSGGGGGGGVMQISMQPSKLCRSISYIDSMASPPLASSFNSGGAEASMETSTPRGKAGGGSYFQSPPAALAHGQGPGPGQHGQGTSPYSSSTNVGRFLNDFDVLGELGTGNFGTVFAAKSKMDGIDYAVKQSRRAFSGDLDRDNMMLEIRACSKLSASSEDDEVFSIVRYFSAWIEDEKIYLHMELCETSVEALLKSTHVFDNQEIFLILRHVLLALKFLHQHAFVHLDVKPANVLRKQGHFKLGDFGLARSFFLQGRVASGVEEGDSRYLAPELLEWNIRDKDLTKCDSFSLGITGYELCTRTALPQNGPMWHALRSNDYPLAPSKDGISQDLVDLVRCLMQQDPAARAPPAACLKSFIGLADQKEREIYYLTMTNEALKSRLSEVSETKQTRLKRHHSII